MEKSYRYPGYFILFIFIITVIGFFKSYFGKFPEFQDLKYTHHLHFLSLFVWFLMLLIQPFLIRTDRLKAHRIVGKSSYVLMVIIVFFMLQVMKLNYTKAISGGSSAEVALGFLYVPFSAMSPFLILYTLAILYRKKSSWHMRYMIATAIALLGPAIGRINFGLHLSLNAYIVFSFCLGDLLLIFLLIFESMNRKIYPPYFVSLVICLIFHVAFPWINQSALWQSAAGLFVRYW